MSGKYEPTIPSTVLAAQRQAMAEFQAATGEATPETAPEASTPPAEAAAPDTATPPPAGPVTSAVAEPAASEAEQRYRVLKGKYDAEVPALHRQVQQLQGSIETLQSLLQRREAQPAASVKPEGKPAATADLTTADLKAWVNDPAAFDDFGEEYWRKEYQRRQRDMQPLKQELDEMRQEREVTRQEREEARLQRLEADLDRLHPDWSRQNQDPRFVQWLNETSEPRSGMRYMLLLQQALKSGDVSAVVRIFADWPEAATSAAPAPAAGRVAPQVPVGRQVTVRPGAPNATPNPATTRVWTEAEIMQAATKIATGELSPERAKALKVEMDAALASGRVR